MNLGNDDDDEINSSLLYFVDASSRQSLVTGLLYVPVQVLYLLRGLVHHSPGKL